MSHRKMDNVSSNYFGEQLTFFDLFREKRWKIEIPIIQRDYAQGRKTTLDVRNGFLEALSLHLESPDEQPIDLDFVFGIVSENKGAEVFVPLDGQQRLTTLFLLHWYLSVKEDQEEYFRQTMLEGKCSKFTYATRTSSQEFCDELVCSSIDIGNLIPESSEGIGDSLSKTIKDRDWYFRSWDNDPTIQSMLVMLDAIHGKFGKSNGFFEKLTRKENPIVTFQFLNLSDFRLTEDLYIKMNARGKQLTAFENFKAKLEQFIGLTIPIHVRAYMLEREGVSTRVSAEIYFSHKIDTDWANLFWKFRDQTHLFDLQIMNFIRVVTSNYLASQAGRRTLRLFRRQQAHRQQDHFLKLLIGKEDVNQEHVAPSPITFSQYRQIDCLNANLVYDLISIFDLVTGDSGNLKVRLPDSLYYEEEKIFKRATKNNLTFSQRIRFHAYCQALIAGADVVQLEEWMRVVFNLTENTLYNHREEFARSIRSIQVMAPSCTNILDYLSDIDSVVTGFFEIQITEERIKAILFKKTSSDWKKEILAIERHGYFNGQIGFLLQFSGIRGYYKEHKNCSWSEPEDAQFFKSFCSYVEKAKSVFGDDGLKSFPNFVWERALLSKGNYLLQSGSNLSFLVDHDRDVSWKRLLRESNDGRRSYVRAVFDDAEFDPRDAQGSLEKIVSNAGVTDWRGHFIKLPETIEYLGEKKYIRWESDGDTILLLKRIRKSANYCEYYSYSYYLKYLRNVALLPFTGSSYEEGNGTQLIPCAELTGWNFQGKSYKLEIFVEEGDSDFTLAFSEKSNLGILDSIVLVLSNLGFKGSDHEFHLRVGIADIPVQFGLVLEALHGL